MFESFVDYEDNYTKDKANEPELKITVTWILNIINYYYSEQHTNRRLKCVKHSNNIIHHLFRSDYILLMIFLI